MRLPDDAPPLKWADPDGKFELLFQNEKKGFSYVEEVLNAQLQFDASDLDHAKERCQDLLAAILNSLVWVTMSMVRQARLVRVVDWSPGKAMRDAFILTQSPRFAVPKTSLIPEVVASASALLAAQQNDRAQSALRWFRLGVGGDGLEDQFTFLWFALETAAEALKQPGKVPTKCPICEEALYCEACNTYPQHRRFAADAIRDVILGSFADEEEGKSAFKTLTKIRHTLMHGRRIESVQKSLPYDAQVATNQLAKIARNAIFNLNDFSKYKNKEIKLSLFESDDIIRGRMIMAARVQTVFGPDPNNPVLGKRDGIQFRVRYPGQADENK
jgi:hypothetical protein